MAKILNDVIIDLKVGKIFSLEEKSKEIKKNFDSTRYEFEYYLEENFSSYEVFDLTEERKEEIIDDFIEEYLTDDLIDDDDLYYFRELEVSEDLLD